MQGLSVQQEQVIDLISAGRSQRDAAEAAGVTEVTVSRWRQSPTFRQALEERREELTAAHRMGLAMLVGKAIETLAALMDDASGHVRLRAALVVLRAAGLDRPAEEDPDQWRRDALDMALDSLSEELGLKL